MTDKSVSTADAARELLARRKARSSFYDWCCYALAPRQQKPARHHRMLIGKLEKVLDGTCDRLMIQMPPGHAKSTYTSELFPPYAMSMFPGSQFISGSAGLGLAMDFSGKVIKLIEEFGPILNLALANSNKELFYTTSGCRYKAAGVGGDIAGTRSDFVLIDDPIGSRADADSPAMRKAAYDWYRGGIVGRAKPGCRVVLIMTRWHEDDLAARLQQDSPDRWTVLNLPALAEVDDPMGREVGEPLWPEYETLEILQEKRRSAGEREWFSQWQQRPAPTDGVLFDIEKLLVSPPRLAEGRLVRAWDLASSAKIGTRDPDYTVGMLMEAVPGGRYLVRDIKRDRGAPQHVEDMILRTAKEDADEYAGHDLTINLPEDPGQAGKAQVASLTKMLAGHVVRSTRPSGNKATRATPYASQVNVGNVMMLAGTWNRPYREELSVFPAGQHDDQIDAGSDGFNFLAAGGRGRGASVQRLGY